jgi:hypothetical protein
MGVWKAQVSFRVREELRRELQDVAERECRTPGNVGQVLLEWATAQLRVAGSIERLRRVQLMSKKGSVAK